MAKDVKRLLLKLLFVIAPALPVVAAYLVLDPFKVIRSYDNYYPKTTNGYVTLNNDFVATETFKNHNATNQYDSFIFGNSRSRFYQVADWRPFLGEAHCFHFDASNETLFGIHGKFRYLDHSGVEIKHALIVLDSGTLTAITNSEGHLFIKHPSISQESRLTFHLTSFQAFLNLKFLVSYVYFAITHKFPASAVGESVNTEPIDYDLYANEYSLGTFERMIAENPSSFYDPRQKYFPPRKNLEAFYSPVLFTGQKALLSDIRDVLKKHHTDYEIVINPLYDQKGIDPGDLAYLKGLFGSERVWDFSGINQFTENSRNYYEISHYRPHVAREIMKIIYTTRKDDK